MTRSVATPRGRAAPEPSGFESGNGAGAPWNLGFGCFGLVFCASLAFGLWVERADPGRDPLDWYASVVWTLPVLASSLGLCGAILTRRRLRLARSATAPPRPISSEMLVVIPTVGRADTYPALERVVRSCVAEFPRFFGRFRVDVVIEEASATADRIHSLADQFGCVRIITVPRGYRTPRGTRFKARANQYALGLRRAERSDSEDVWVLHMDDDTAVGPDTVLALARFVSDQQAAGPDGLLLCQGVLCYPRELAANRFTWFADAIRPGCDISLFAATTGTGSPWAGLHGELLMVRADVEAAIGWDFGPRAIVEDAQFALLFCQRFPGRSDWLLGRCYGASPATVPDLVRQRERWVWGLLELAGDRSIAVRARLLILHNVIVWACGPIAHPGVVLLVGALTGDLRATPVIGVLLPVWALNLGFCAWLYWEGLKINAASSARPGRLWWEAPCLLLLMPLFSLCEVTGLARGLLRFSRRSEPRFTVIAKPV